MVTRISAFALLTLVVAPVALAGLAPDVNPVLNPDFDTYAVAGVSDDGRFALDRCFGAGHQVFDPFYSPWADEVLAAVSEPAALVAAAQDPATPGALTQYPLAHAASVAGEPSYAYGCSPAYRDAAQLNAWEKTRDVGFAWSNDAGTKFYDIDSDGDVEAVIPARPVQHAHALWQSVATPAQAFSANFATFEWTLESGVVPPGANNQIGLSFSPGHDANPWVGVFWDGAVLFRASDMTPDEDGRVRMDPATQGEIICPAYPPCTAFKAAFDAASADERRTLLGQARVVQTSFWGFAGGVGPVALDDVAYVGMVNAAEGVVAAQE